MPSLQGPSYWMLDRRDINVRVPPWQSFTARIDIFLGAGGHGIDLHRMPRTWQTCFARIAQRPLVASPTILALVAGIAFSRAQLHFWARDFFCTAPCS